MLSVHDADPAVRSAEMSGVKAMAGVTDPLIALLNVVTTVRVLLVMLTTGVATGVAVGTALLTITVTAEEVAVLP